MIARNSRNLTFSSEFSSQCQIISIILNLGVHETLAMFGVIGNVLACMVLSKMKLIKCVRFLLYNFTVLNTVILISKIVALSWLQGFVYLVKIRTTPEEIVAYVQKYYNPIAMMLLFAQTWLIVTIAGNRYVTICMPSNVQKLVSLSRTAITICITSLAGIVLFIPQFFYVQIYQIHEGNQTLVVAIDNQTSLFRMIYSSGVAMALLDIVPLMFILFSSVRVIATLRATKRQQPKPDHRTTSHPTSVHSMLLTLVVLFLVLNLPRIIADILLNFTGKLSGTCTDHGYQIRMTADILCTLYCSSHFLIYICTNKDARSIAVGIISCSKGHEHGENGTSTEDDGSLSRTSTSRF